MTGKERLENLIAAIESNPNKLAKSIGVSTQGIYDVLNGKAADISRSLAVKIREVYPQFNLNWLLTGEGSMLKSNASLKKQNHEGTPYLGELDIFAGQMDVAHADLSEYITEYISIPGFKDANYFVNVRGHSMYPKYAAGEIIAIKLVKDMTEIQYGQAYVIITHENRVLKYVRKAKSNNGTLLLVSENSSFDSYEVEKKNVKAMFLVLGKITKDVL